MNETLDPSVNVKAIVEESVQRLDDLRKAEVKRIDEKIDSHDIKYQIQFTDSKDAVQAALTATKEAINKADQANEKRFDAVNEFRATLGDQQTKLITRTEYESAHDSLAEKINGVTDRINRTEGASGVYVTHDDLNIAIDKLQTSIQNTLQPVVAFMNSQTGRSTGTTSVYSAMGTMVSIAIAGVLLILRLLGK